MKDDLPLLRFDFRKRECDVVVFPIAARIGKTRHVAEKLMGIKHDKVRKNYWARITGSLASELRHRGYTDERILTELEAFRDAVASEMRKAAAIAKQSPRPAEWDDGPQTA